MINRTHEVSRISPNVIGVDFYGVQAMRGELGAVFEKADPRLVEAVLSNVEAFSPTMRTRLGLDLSIDAKIDEPVWKVPGIRQVAAFLPKINTAVINPLKHDRRREIAEIRIAVLPYVHQVKPEVYERRKRFAAGKRVETAVMEYEEVVVAGIAQFSVAEIRANQAGLTKSEKDKVHLDLLERTFRRLVRNNKNRGHSQEYAQNEAWYHQLIRGHEFVKANVDYLTQHKGMDIDAVFRLLILNHDLFMDTVDEASALVEVTLDQRANRFIWQPGL